MTRRGKERHGLVKEKESGKLVASVVDILDIARHREGGGDRLEWDRVGVMLACARGGG